MALSALGAHTPPNSRHGPCVFSRSEGPTLELHERDVGGSERKS